MPMIRNAYRPGNFNVCAPMPTLRQHIDAFLRRSGMPRTVFGREALNDPSFMVNLERGRRVSPHVEARVRAFIRGYGE